MSESIVERSAPVDPPRATVLVPGAVAVLVSAALAAWGTYGETHHETGEYLIVLGIIAAATAVVFGWVVPRGLRRESAGTTALVLSLLGLVAVAVFWSGLTPVLATGGIVLGWAGRNARRGSRLSTAALAIGAFAVTADVAVYIQDMAF